MSATAIATATVTTSSSSASSPFASNAERTRRLRFINPKGSAAFDFSVDGGATYQAGGLPATDTGSATSDDYAEDHDFESYVHLADLRVRRNGATNVAGMIVRAYF